MIGKLYLKYFKNKLFNRILVTYSAIIIILSFGLASMASNNIRMSIISKEKDHAAQILNTIDTYFEQRLSISKNLSQQLYTNHSFHSEVTHLINSGFEKYLEYKLDRFSTSTESTYYGFETLFESTMTYYNDIVSIGIHSFKMDTVFVFFDDFRIVTPQYFFADSKLPVVAEKKIIPSHNISYLTDNNSETVYTVVYPIIDRYSLESIGLLAVSFDISILDKLASDQSGKVQRFVSISTMDGQIIYNYNREYIKNSFQISSILLNTSDENIYSMKTYEDMGIILAVVTPSNYIMDTIFQMTNTIYLVTVFCVLGAILLTYLTIKTFSKNLGLLLNGFRTVRNGDLSVRIPVSHKKDEISEISTDFNSMCHELSKYINRVYISEIKQKNAQIKALEAQINPHFLYNTLEAIRMKAIIDGSSDAGDMIFYLSQLFRRSIKEDMIISIDKELEYSKMYLKLMNLQYMDNIKVNFSIEEDTLSFSIIKHSLQPLIENSIKHGFNLSQPNNTITIKILKDKEDILVYVIDNGKGMELEILEHVKKSLMSEIKYGKESLGLININERIKLIYGLGYGIDVYSVAGKGCEVVIRVPAIKKEALEGSVQGIDSR
ncbi:UNVERIFIED_CONTAM: two-component system sensor histidine kinase YesM [Acetivibrio alkalicellulosi]